MKREPVTLEVSDHAVLRWLERVHGLDVPAIRAMLQRHAEPAAELGAVAVVIDQVRLVLASDRPGHVTVVTTLGPGQRADKHYRDRMRRNPDE